MMGGLKTLILTATTLMVAIGCAGKDVSDSRGAHGPIAEGIMAPMGEPIPSATPEQLATFERGRKVMQRRFTLEDGLGPAFNITSCGGCHEKPTAGGSAALYRNFFIAGVKPEGGPFSFVNAPTGDVCPKPGATEKTPYPESSSGAFAGVIRQFYHGVEFTARPHPLVDQEAGIDNINVVGQRNPIPFFGVGLIAELDIEEIEKRADPDDADGDGISGKVNYISGNLLDEEGNIDEDRVVGRFGLKAQTGSIEGFIRGPLFNHLGITTDPLCNADLARLPVDSRLPEDPCLRIAAAEKHPDAASATEWLADRLRDQMQAVASGGPNCDLDDAPDPEMSAQELFDLVSFSMLLAAPEIEEPSPQAYRGMERFNEVGCFKCHTPRLQGPRGPVPAYSDLLLHDMGPELDDGLPFARAETFEFRTQPLWGVAATAPYLHDGRAGTLDEAIRWHGGEATASRKAYAALSESDREDLIEFLMSLGGRAQRSSGLIPPNTPIALVGTEGGPTRNLSDSEKEKFLAGREAFDRDFSRSQGVGGPRMNGDSCRACHFDPVVGGAGPRGVNVMRHGILNMVGDFVAPSIGTVLHKTTTLLGANFPQPDATIFEHRQTPSLLGLGLLEQVPREIIEDLADPDDEDADGISGKLSIADDGRLGRFGWKAQVPSLEEFIRDAVTTELGMTLPAQDGLTFGRIHDNDDIPDPEFDSRDAEVLLFWMKELGPPPRRGSPEPMLAELGESLFESVGCAKCHMPSLPTADGGEVRAYTDMLLHDILPPEAVGIEETSATMHEFRTPPLWGISQTEPYLHSGEADTLDQAIRAHDGEARQIREAYEGMTSTQQRAIALFLETL